MTPGLLAARLFVLRAQAGGTQVPEDSLVGQVPSNETDVSDTTDAKTSDKDE